MTQPAPALPPDAPGAGDVPGSVSFRAALAERRLGLVAWRLLVLQASHPFVAAGMDRQSTYRGHPWRRIEHTLGSGRRLFHSGPDALRREIARLERAHRRVEGTDEQGRSYSALDPATRVWVLVTLYECVVMLRELSGAPYRPAELDTLYAEFREVVTAFGLPAELLPATAADVAGYVEAMVRDTLEFGPAARYLLYGILREAPCPRRLRRLGPVWPVLRPVIAWTLTTLTLADLPATYRERFGLARTRRAAALSYVLHRGTRVLTDRLPEHLRQRRHAEPGTSGAAAPEPAGTAVAPARTRARWRRDARRPRLEDFFRRVMDQTGDGHVDAEDLRAMAHNVCWQLELDDAGEARVYAAFATWWEQIRSGMDTDGDGRVGRAEFAAATMAGCDRDPAYLEGGLLVAVRAMFDAADSDADGHLDAGEYQVLFGGRVHAAELAHGFQRLDIDGDGLVTREEFERGFTGFFTGRTGSSAGEELLGRA